MDILERLRRIKKGLWIAVGVAFGVLFLLVALVVAAALILQAWDARNAPKIVKNQIGIVLISVSPGSFLMGANARDDEKPAHQVNLRKGFLIGRFAVTYGAWTAGWGRE